MVPPWGGPGLGKPPGSRRGCLRSPHAPALSARLSLTPLRLPVCVRSPGRFDRKVYVGPPDLVRAAQADLL